ncbi:hypothetical protein [Chitinimonas sp. BJB300]|uniref:hypothetical protein n=1 Tax=Chitinimonas sp. BJB300 TaxID=1559339 RepID=UPI000C116768|nr:hypothetical protein [Chitinimonas sp. BJB300]PHV11216.1 hypothetical protein CSQ89_12035 [Chitinimonas sp. BJB300]TSJ87375.1 hypothetical protein FG002_014155 [Chitinimonas sp. BJB300]
MRLIVTARPEPVLARLNRAGFCCELLDGTHPASRSSQGKETNYIGLCTGNTLPALQAHDLLIYADTPIPNPLPANAITAAWQDSPFAEQYGFQLAAGGSVDMLKRAEDILDALAPLPRGWLHAGGLLAPQFLSQLSHEVGSGLLGLASLIHTVPFAAFQPLWLGQQQIQAKIKALAIAYQQSSQNEHYQPFHARPPLFDFVSATNSDSPAHRLAQLLIWLCEQSALPSSSNPDK